MSNSLLGPVLTLIYGIECDKCFTRSDALAKHMRIVHETEALRPSDPIPKTMQPILSKSKNRLKVIIKQPDLNGTTTSSPNQSPVTATGPSNTLSQNGSSLTGLPSDLFTPEEIALGPKELYRLLRRQAHWSEEESNTVQREYEMIEGIRRKEWEEKEVLLDQVIKNEIDWHERRRLVIAALPPAPSSAELRQKLDGVTEKETYDDEEREMDTEPDAKLEIAEDQAEAAAALASLSNS